MTRPAAQLATPGLVQQAEHEVPPKHLDPMSSVETQSVTGAFFCSSFWLTAQKFLKLSFGCLCLSLDQGLILSKSKLLQNSEEDLDQGNINL